MMIWLSQRSLTIGFALLGALFCIFLLIVNLTYSAPQDLPPGFAEVQITKDLSLPLDMEFAPNGDIWVAEKGIGADETGTSHIKLITNGYVQEVPILSISTNTFWDSGLLAFVLDPHFAQNGYFYVAYATGQDALNWSGESKLRLSRFTYNGDTKTAPLSSEQILLDGLEWNHNHHGNGLLFDQDGSLYWALGDRDDTELAQTVDNDRGKILRIKPTENGYMVPADNPFVGVPGALPEVYAYGLRNPYRLANRADGAIIIADVGELTWEEVNLLQPGANYGWPLREGPCPKAQVRPCEAADSAFTDPLFTYPHNDPDQGLGPNAAVTGIDFYEGDAFPESYHGKLFFADYNQEFLAVADIDVPETFSVFAQVPYGVVDIEYYNGGLYYLMIWGGLRYIYHTGSDNQVPDARLTADTVYATAPATVNFSAAESVDVDDIQLTYHWDMGDGSVFTTTTPVVSHSYEEDGTYTAELFVTDLRGGQSATVAHTTYVYSGEHPQLILNILNDVDRNQWRGGDSIAYIALRSTMEDLDTEQPFEWAVDLHHNEHTHPIITGQTAISNVLQLDDDNHGGDWNLWFRFYLTMRTASGQEIVYSREAHPEFVTVTVATEPSKVSVTVNGAKQTPPHVFRSIVNVTHDVSVPDEAINKNDVIAFSYWEQHPIVVRSTYPFAGLSSTSPELTLTAPETATQYTAVYTYSRPADLFFGPLMTQSKE